MNFTLFNLFDEDAGVSKYSTYQKTNGVQIDQPNPCIVNGKTARGKCLGGFYTHKVNIDL